MRKRLLAALLLASATIFLMQCTDNKESNPTNSSLPDTLTQIGGILDTDDLGYVQGGDQDDWCYNFDKKTENDPPTEYALYPAFPNSSYYYFTIIYDLPAESDVSLTVVDTSLTVVNELVNETQVAGRYISGWDITDTIGNRLDPGIYRVIITAGDFECYGDIEVTPVPEPDSGSIVFRTSTSNGNMDISYDSPVEVGALWMVFTTNGSVGDPSYNVVAYFMNKLDNLVISNSDDKPDTLKILISTPLDQVRTLPSGLNELCRVPIISGQLTLDYVEASDGFGALIPAAIIKSP